MNDENSRNLKKLLACAALLMLLGLIGGARLAVQLRREGAGVAVARGTQRGSDDAALTGQAAALWSRLLAALSPNKGSRPFTIERLLQLLLKNGGDPLANAFAEDFSRDSELMAIWSEFVRSGGKLDAAWLAQKLSESKRFVALLNRYSHNARFRRLGDGLARGLSGESSQAGAAGRLAGGDMNGDGGGTAGGPRSGGERGSARVSAVRGAPSKDTVPAASAAGAVGPGRDGGRQASRTTEEAHETLRLIAPLAAGPAATRDPWASLCFQNNPAITRAQCAAINRHLGEDALWNACQKAGLLDKCVTLCRGDMDLGCDAEARDLQECRRRSSAAECADACSRGDCRAAARSNEPEPAAVVAAVPAQSGPDGPEPGRSTEPAPETANEPRPAAEERTPPTEATTTPPADPKVMLPVDGAVPRQTVAPTPPPQPAPPPKKKKKLPPWLEDIIDFFDDLFG